MSGVEMPLVAVRAQVASAINVIVCCERMPDGTRKVTHVSEVLPLSDRGDYRTQHVWVYSSLGKDEDGNTIGFHAPTGIVPQFVHRLRATGFGDLEDRFFDPQTHGLPAPPAHQVSEELVQRWVPSLRHREKGQPDPDSYRQQLAAYERKLRDEARLRAAKDLEEDAGPTQAHSVVAVPRPPPAPARPPPQAAPVRPAAPRPPPPQLAVRVPSAGKPMVADADKTPPPSRYPVGQSPTSPELSAEDEDPRSVEISADYLQEAVAKEPTDRKPPPAARPAGGPPRGVTTGRTRPVEDDVTNVRAPPEKPRR
jgi:pilus assembly protein CpaF